MSIEQALAENTAALKELTAVLAKNGGAAASAETTAASTGKGGRGKAAANKETGPKHTAEEVKAAAVKVKDELGTKAAKQLIKDHGADELAALKPEQYDAFIAAAEKLLAGDGDGDGDGDDGL